jgi:hypothetical protein
VSSFYYTLIQILFLVERLGIMKEHAAQQREQLYKEFGYYLSMQLGFGAASVRMVRLMTLLCDVKMYAIETGQFVSKNFSPKIRL